MNLTWKYVLIVIAFLSMWVSPVAQASSFYKVKSGDTLWRISTSQHTSVDTLMKLNHLSNTLIFPGEHLQLLPIETTHHTVKLNFPRHSTARKSLVTLHVVQAGDTLWSLAEVFHTSPNTLERLNHLHGSLILVGETLKLPALTSHHTTLPLTLQGAPSWLIRTYQKAGQQYGITWTILAAIHKQETNFGTKGCYISSAGAIGPMQFMPSTFAAFAVLAPGQSGKPNINNVYDAIYTAARMLAADGFHNDPFEAIYAYNHSVAYVDSILRLSAV